MTVEELIRGVPGQEHLCLWQQIDQPLEKTQERYDVRTGGRSVLTYQRRCGLERGHPGPHVMASFIIRYEEREPGARSTD